MSRSREDSEEGVDRGRGRRGARSASDLVRKVRRSISSHSSEAKKLSVIALSKHVPLRPVDGRTPACSQRWPKAIEVIQAPPEIRDRLGLDEPEGDTEDVVRTEYVFSADGEPVMLSTSGNHSDLPAGHRSCCRRTACWPAEEWPSGC